ncbi:Reverse transcriptase [Phytophthora palmivora]|uniref:Reverse transcriptase n=1 Tax=Phytophthora palmivora TaxID=4796 RepID=A0A2P4XFF4_9STRA|nr:Reverse transcriptase [Phytophthora palmivora]
MSALLNHEELPMKDFLAELKAGEIAEMVFLKPETSPEDLNSSSVMDEDVLEGFAKQRATRLGSEILKNPEDPVYPLVNEFSDVMSKHPPSQLPPDRGVRHDINLVPGTEYCVARQWPLPREQCEVIDAFFVEKAKSGMVRESKSPHSTPTFCVRKPNGKWRLVHAYNKLNNAAVPAQTPIPRKDVLLNNMSGCTLYSALDLIDGYYQILMGEVTFLSPQRAPRADALGVASDAATRTFEYPSDVQSLGHTIVQTIARAEGGQTAMEVHLKHLRRVFEVMRANKLYANIGKVGVRADPGKVKAIAALSTPRSQKDFDDIFVHSRAEGGQTAMEVHLKHLRRVFEVMRANKLYANIGKCVFAAEEIKVLGCFVSRVGVRADPGKVKAIAARPTPRSQKGLQKFLGLANYLHKYSAGYAELALSLWDLLKKDADWVWEQQHQDAFDNIKASLQQVPVLALPDENKSFSIVCDASDYVIGGALLQKDDEGRERVISFQSRQLKAAERNYPVHEKELLAMKPFVIFAATNSPHLSQRMTRWLSFFAEYNFRVEYKPGKLNVLADAPMHCRVDLTMS